MRSVRQVAEVLERAGVPSPLHDARILVEHASRTGQSLADLVGARARRVPLQHLTGSVGFRYLDLAVGPGVFVPRPETEVVVQAVLDEVAGRQAPLVVDLCAGSGAVGLSVAREHPGAVVHLVERSAEAMPWLRRNASDIQGVHLHEADAEHALHHLDGTADVVVSNPPYVAEAERPLVDVEVRDHDPGIALWAGEDGLEVIRVVVRRSAELLRAGGLLVVEHSDRQHSSVPQLVRDHGFVDVDDRQDLTGRPRFTVGRRPW